MRSRVPAFLARLARIRELRALPFIAVLAIIFFALSLTVRLPGMLSFDHGITLAIQSHRAPPLDRTAAAFTFLGNTVTLMALGAAALVAFAVSGKPRTGLLCAAVLTALPLNEAIKHLIGRPRPTGDLVDIILPAVGLSFPSGHATASVAFYGFLSVLSWIHIQRRAVRNMISLVFASIAICVAVSRIYLGVHWFSDVIGGVTAGLILIYVSAQIYKTFGLTELAPSPRQLAKADRCEGVTT